jgi:hypothetical protein
MKGDLVMKVALSKSRIVLGRVSRETKGPPGFTMEPGGLWDKPHTLD